MKTVYKVNEIVKGLESQIKLTTDKYKKVYTEELNTMLIDMLDYVDVEMFECERAGKGFNRGVIGENLIRYHIMSYVDIEINGLFKSLDKDSDINTLDYDSELLKDLGLEKGLYEVKTLSKISNAYGSKHDTKKYIILDLKYTNSVVLVDKKDLVFNPSGHIKAFKNYKKLELLTELIGL